MNSVFPRVDRDEKTRVARQWLHASATVVQAVSQSTHWCRFAMRLLMRHWIALRTVAIIPFEPSPGTECTSVLARALGWDDVSIGWGDHLPSYPPTPTSSCDDLEDMLRRHFGYKGWDRDL